MPSSRVPGPQVSTLRAPFFAATPRRRPTPPQRRLREDRSSVSRDTRPAVVPPRHVHPDFPALRKPVKTETGMGAMTMFHPNCHARCCPRLRSRTASLFAAAALACALHFVDNNNVSQYPDYSIPSVSATQVHSILRMDGWIDGWEPGSLGVRVVVSSSPRPLFHNHA
ncbi:hypothetical protein HYPSUDRAFT_209975 [Hypholoma sublateritium FD-334 SS-4]|uniref:Uncharacterized protein n=1 Tax=Hypholoma sublateritium (strain FD-334 SS-4) TaxID=945553 RepID=A0A0D2KEJ1_HYPSF|nr:hypothetical protein HYPSUDRAFT_209975 [Hypholoma sublateritium FD-334 SS-4]